MQNRLHVVCCPFYHAFESNLSLDSSKSRFFCMIHKIEDFALWAAILDECQIYLGGDTCLLTTCETKMASHVSKKQGAVNSLSCPWLLQVLTGLHTAIVTTEISCPISNIGKPWSNFQSGATLKKTSIAYMWNQEKGHYLFGLFLFSLLF